METLPKLSPAQNLLLRTSARRAYGRVIPPLHHSARVEKPRNQGSRCAMSNVSVSNISIISA